jgi:radical SAM superfamily enzyme YgiQ (UPF0313 family)
MAGGLGFDGGVAVCLPPLDLMYYGSTLESRGFEVALIDADAEGLSEDDVRNRVMKFAPEAIIATLSLPTLQNDAEFIKSLKSAAGTTKIFVKTGVRYPALLQEILNVSNADLVIHGECDSIIDKIIEGKSFEGTARLLNDGVQVENEKLLDDLDALPMPARHLLDNSRYSYDLLGKPATSMQTSRGCPFPCAFYCPYPLVQGTRWRARSAEHVVAEIEEIVQKYKVRKILFRDATFTLDRKRTERICNLIFEKGLNITWWCETRLNCIDPDLLQLMKLAGLQGMNVGVETGDPQVMKDHAKAGVTMEQVISIRKTAKKLGVRLHFLLMTGLPEESKSSLFETFKLVHTVKPDSIGVTIVTPYPGTPLYDEAIKKGWIEVTDWNKFGGHCGVMHTDKLSRFDLKLGQRMIMAGHAFLKKENLSGRIAAKLLERVFFLWTKF